VTSPNQTTQSAPESQPASQPSQSGQSPLDNPILNSLLTGHSALALAHGHARRFPAEIGPLSGLPDQSPENYRDLRALAGISGVVVLFFQEPPAPPAGWTLLRGGLLDQMVCTEPNPRQHTDQPLPHGIRRLTADDAEAMVELARLTEPGPFYLRTHELGAFFGYFEGALLLAMAGQRLSLPGFVEVSAVCTHPDARGRGLAPTLMSLVMADIVAHGKTPMLHSWSSNAPAIAVYKKLGFTFRRNFHLAVLQNDL
jgi:ribosomal protein S18 acetylase RimI-like enzyme